MFIVSFFPLDPLAKPVARSLMAGQMDRNSFIAQLKAERRSSGKEQPHIYNKRGGWDEIDKDNPDEVDPVNDYEMYEELAGSYGYSAILPFLRQHFKTCPSDTPKVDCRPFYMPCKSELACAISCRVNDYSCGSCSDTNSFRKVCQCCDVQVTALLAAA